VINNAISMIQSVFWLMGVAALVWLIMAKRTARQRKARNGNPFASSEVHAFEWQGSDLPRIKRIEYMKEAAISAGKDFERDLRDLHSELLKHNPIHLLCQLSFYTLHSTDPAPDEWKDPDRFFQHHLEVLQGLLLKHPWDEYALERTDPQKTIDSIKELSRLFAFKRGQTISADMDKKAERTFTMREAVRMHTQGVRNWSYPQFIFSISRKLMESMDEVCLKEHGIKASRCVDLIEDLIGLSEARLSAFINEKAQWLTKRTKSEMFEAYRSLYPHCQWLSYSQKLVEDRSVSLKQLEQHLWICSDFMLPLEVFAVRPEHIEIVSEKEISVDTAKSLLDLWSMGFGDVTLKDEHLFMGNPVLQRPFINTTHDFYVLAIPGILLSFGLQMVEQLFNSPESKLAYEKARATFLEDEIASLMENSFPRGKLYRNSEWKSDKDGKTYENDCLVILDTAAFILEAKSGKVDPSARRGGDRLDNNVKELIVEPSDQASRFADFLSRHKGILELTTRDGKTNRIDTSRVTQFIPISVMLDDLTLPFNRDVLIDFSDDAESNVSPAFLLADLMICMDLLESETMRAHYLIRRHEFNRRQIRFLGDEIDLLAVYMRARLLVKVPEGYLYLGAGEAHPIDKYYLNQYEGVDIAKPVLPLTDRFKALLSTVDSKRDEDRWLDVGSALLDVTLKDQKKIEEQLRKLASKVRSGKEKFMTLTFKNNATESEIPLVFVVLPQQGDRREMFLQGLESARHAAETKTVLGFALDAFDLSNACTAIAFSMDDRDRQNN